MKKKLLLILIALLCCMSGMWAQTFYAEYKDGTLTFYYDSYSSSRTGTIYTAVRAKNLPSSSWGEKAGQITSVVFDSSVANYHDLTTTASWFKSCTKLTEVKGLSNLYTYNVTDMSYMFDYCSSLENIDLSGFYTGNVTNMTAMFENCKKLVSLDLSSFNTSKVQYMRLMFYGCSILSDIYVGTGWSTASATSYDSMFWGCDNLVGEDYTQYSSSAQSGAKAHYGAGGYLATLPPRTRRVLTPYSTTARCRSTMTTAVPPAREPFTRLSETASPALGAARQRQSPPSISAALSPASASLPAPSTGSTAARP